MDARQKSIIEPFLESDLEERRREIIAHIQLCVNKGQEISAFYKEKGDPNQTGIFHEDDFLLEEWLDIKWWYDLVKKELAACGLDKDPRAIAHFEMLSKFEPELKEKLNITYSFMSNKYEI